MSTFFQNNKTILHIASEIIVFCAISVFFYRKIGNITESIKNIENKLNQMDRFLSEQQQLNNQLVTQIKILVREKKYFEDTRVNSKEREKEIIVESVVLKPEIQEENLDDLIKAELEELNSLE